MKDEIRGKKVREWKSNVESRMETEKVRKKELREIERREKKRT